MRTKSHRALKSSAALAILWANFFCEPAFAAGDLEDTFAYLRGEAEDDAALAMLNSRDVTVGRALDSYDCVADSVIDGQAVLRTNSFLRLIDRRCREEMWKRDALPGYRTLGQVRLTARDVQPWIAAASRETEIPELILETIVRFESGFRPGVISERGEMGLMQLRPEAIAEMNLQNPLDGEENIRAGARYLAKLIDHFDGVLEPALAAYKVGIEAVEREGRITPGEPRVLWFVREVRRLYKAQVDEFPNAQAADDMTYVMNWLER